LIVHRDLKPSNVLVTPVGEPKLLDFGVASMLGRESAGDLQGLPLTPAFASPEVLAGASASVRSDVYSLGVLLRELLAVGNRADAKAPALANDLGAIVGRALAADPAARYPSALHFGQDLERFQKGEPVNAQRSTWIYRTRLLLRRKRYSILFAACILLALAGGWIASDIERRSASQEASVGWGAHSQAKYASRLLEDWIVHQGGADPEWARESAAYLGGIIDGQLQGLPETETLLRTALARLLLEYGQAEQARPHVERAWELALATRGIGRSDRDRIAELRAELRLATSKSR